MSAGPTAEDHETLLRRVADLEAVTGALHDLVRRLRTDTDDLRADLGELEAHVDEVDQRNEVAELQLDIQRLEQEKADL